MVSRRRPWATLNRNSMIFPDLIFHFLFSFEFSFIFFLSSFPVHQLDERKEEKKKKTRKKRKERKKDRAGLVSSFVFLFTGFAKKIKEKTRQENERKETDRQVHPRGWTCLAPVTARHHVSWPAFQARPSVSWACLLYQLTTTWSFSCVGKEKTYAQRETEGSFGR